jgi:hypothetical protein
MRAERRAELAEIRRIERAEAEAKAQAKHAVQDRARDEREAALREQLADLQAKLDGPKRIDEGLAAQQMLAESLKAAYPNDVVTHIRRGQAGPDILLGVEGAGRIAVESKRAKNWVNAWLTKLVTDRSKAGATFGLLVSEAAPPEHLALPDGIYVADFDSALTVVSVLREVLIKVADYEQQHAARSEAKDSIYDYVTGTRLAARLSTINHAWLTDRAELEKEVRTHERDWRARRQASEQGWSDLKGMIADLADLGVDLNL